MHPDVFSDAYDKVALWDMEAACIDLAIAYYWTGKPAYAPKAAEIVRSWFIDPATQMNPFAISFLPQKDRNLTVHSSIGTFCTRL